MLATSAHTKENQAMFFPIFAYGEEKNFAKGGLGRFGQGVNTKYATAHWG